MRLNSRDVHVFILPIELNTNDTIIHLASNYSDKKLQITRAKNKKPFFKNIKNLYFNKSHSGEKLIVAFSRSEIGIDLEKLKTRKRQDLVAKKISAPKEYSKFLRSKNKKLEFYKLWTKKEALAKLSGHGLRLSFKKISKLKAHTKTKKINNYLFTVATKQKIKILKLNQVI